MLLLIFIPGLHLEYHYSRFMERIPAHLPTAAKILALSSLGGSSIHIKAEVTHRAGECTNEALAVMMGGSSSCWSNLFFCKLHLCAVEGLLQFASDFIIVCCLNDTLSLTYCYHYHLNKNLAYSPPKPKPVLIWLNSFLPMFAIYYCMYSIPHWLYNSVA